MARLDIVLIAGTRPEAIKLAPLLKEFAKRPGLRCTLMVSGQHARMAHDALAEFGLAADIDLAIPNPAMDSFCQGLDAALTETLPALDPDLVLVQGDTNTAWVAAMTATRIGYPVGHVEAGLRSGDLALPWPEERNRCEIDAVSALLFTPSARATREIASLPGTVHQTGNTGIDALFDVLGGSPFAPKRTSARKQIFVTCHRREAIFHLPELALALRTIADRPDVKLHLPLHPNPALSHGLGSLLADHPNIRLDPPMGYRELIAALAETDLLLTDSGGLQEEAPALGIPTLVLRSTTERWESVESGNARLVGLNPATIVAETNALLDDPYALAAMAHPSFPYGHGKAAVAIADAIEAWCPLPLPFPLRAACSKGAAHGRTDYGDELDAPKLASTRSEAASRLS